MSDPVIYFDSEANCYMQKEVLEHVNTYRRIVTEYFYTLDPDTGFPVYVSILHFYLIFVITQIVSTVQTFC